MVVIQLTDGLGNQLFQYAAGLALADQLGCTLLADTLHYKENTLRKYELNLIARPPAIFSGWKSRGLRYLFKYGKRDQVGNWQLVEEKMGTFREFPAEPSRNYYLTGYWQSPRYFESIRSKLRDVFSPKNPLEGRWQDMFRQVQTTDSIVIHIRRGDYVSDPHTKQSHGTVSPEYYKHGIMQVSERLSDPRLFIFSDDISWVKSNLKFDFPSTFVSAEGSSSADDALKEIYLMSNCKHHVIANSSFSWWGAWLAHSPEQCVIAPEKWFADPTRNNPLLIPSNWLTLAS